MGIALSFDDEHKVMREMCGALDRNLSYVLIIVKNKDGCRRRSYELRDLDLRISIPPNPPLTGL